MVYVATWMQEHSVVCYDEQLNRTVESGGDGKHYLDPATAAAMQP